MRRNKHNTIRLFYIVVWSIIIIIAFNLTFKFLRVTGKTTYPSTALAKESYFVSNACNYMIQSNIPILDYVENKDKNKGSNLLNSFIGVFPINRYVASISNHSYDFIDENPDAIIAEDSENFYNNDLLYPYILDSLNNNIEETQESKEPYDMEDSSATDDTMDLDNNESLHINVESSSNVTDITEGDSMPIDIIDGEVYFEVENTNFDEVEYADETISSKLGETFTLEQLKNRSFLYGNFYIVDGATRVDDNLFNVEKLLKKDMTMELKSEKPQILIYHTHSQEGFADSIKGKEDDTIVGVGTYLTEILVNDYGLNVIHDKSEYDMMEGYEERNLAYNHARNGIEKILKENPSIEVVIDLHRDSRAAKVININGLDCAEIMLFNGLSRNTKGPINRLENPNLQANLAFSLQMQLKGRELYPGLMFKNYLHAYRYNTHFREKSLLIEAGTVSNNVGDVKNSMVYLADILYKVLGGN